MVFKRVELDGGDLFGCVEGLVVVGVDVEDGVVVVLGVVGGVGIG